MGKNYRDLMVWQRAIQLVKRIYTLTKKFPSEELYGLTSQIRKAAVSVPSNVAEGQARQAVKDFIRFLNIAKGSLAEVDTQVVIAGELGYMQEKEVEANYQEILEISKMLQGLITSLEEKHGIKSVSLSFNS